MEKKKGFNKYAASDVHIQAMAAWNELEKIQKTNQEVSTLEINRYYITTVLEVIQFLCINEVSLRCDGYSGVRGDTWFWQCGSAIRTDLATVWVHLDQTVWVQ